MLFRLSVLLGVTRGSLSSLACQHTYLLSALLWASSYILIGVYVSYDSSTREKERKRGREREAMRKDIKERNRPRDDERRGALFSVCVHMTVCPCVRGDTTTGSWRPPPDLASVGRSDSTLASSPVQTLDYISGVSRVSHRCEPIL